MDMHPTPASQHPGAELGADDQRRLVHRLQQDWIDAGIPVEFIETHISYVLVAPDHAYKFKKAVELGFLDFTTRRQRLHFCEEELRLNRRLAPELYLGVVAITGTPQAPRLGGSGESIDHAVLMRSFDQAGLWDRLAARKALTAAHVDALAAIVCRFHRAASPVDPASRLGTPHQVREPMLDNLRVLDGLLDDALDRERLHKLATWEAAAFDSLETVFARRRREGRVRECHGDLHLGNVVQIEGRPVVFDCIEFNDDFRWIDVMSELAFMAMDLRARGEPGLANRFVNACLEHAGDRGGARVLRYYVVHRALVRAKVAALRGRQEAAETGHAEPHEAEAVRHYLDLAVDSSHPPHPRLFITHGPAGSGKTTQTAALVEALGAIRIRADVERKRLHGLDALQRSGSPLGGGLYSDTATHATYASLCEQALDVLDGGCDAVLDATFLHRWQRDLARRAAAARGVRFVILDFDADAPTLRARVKQRAAARDDASEADLAVLESQLRSAEPLDEQERGLALRWPDAADGLAQVLAALEQPASPV